MCPRCHTLVRAEELTRISTEVKRLEAQREWMRAREQWLVALPMLPVEAQQAEWIRAHVVELEGWRTRLLSKSLRGREKTRPCGADRAVADEGQSTAGIAGVQFSIQLYCVHRSVLGTIRADVRSGLRGIDIIDEMGHFVEVKRRGLPADLPVFCPGFGAYVRWQNLGVSLQGRAAISLAGPFAVWIAAIGCMIAWKVTGDPIWAALAHTSAWLNVLNLIPVWALDGGHAMEALDKFERLVIVTVSVGLWITLHESRLR